MQDQYFWSSQMPAPDAWAAPTDAYFRSMLHLPLDRYSYTQPAAAFDQFYREGTRTGYGYTVVWADAAQTQLRVRHVEPHSPVGGGGPAPWRPGAGHRRAAAAGRGAGRCRP
jgi:hypothetical protein